MNKEFSNFAARLREMISNWQSVIGNRQFSKLALELFALQFKYNFPYRKICEAHHLTPEVVEHWTQIPAVPMSAFKELELSCIPAAERTAAFHSSGTTEQKPSRHCHSPESLKIYEASLLPWFLGNVLPDLRFTIYDLRLVCLTPTPQQAPHSSLVHMFETVRRKIGAPKSAFVVQIAPDGSWTLDFDAALAALSPRCQTPDARPQTPNPKPRLLLGTAFSFVHLLDFLEVKDLRFDLPAGSRVMETGGYKNRSRSMPKAELHALITERLGIPPEYIISEYGMSELSSQAYDGTIQADNLVLPHPPPSAVLLRRTGGPLPKERENCRQSVGESGAVKSSKDRTLLFSLSEGEGQGEGKHAVKLHYFRFPSWARVQIISPETGREVADGETGLIRVFDLGNVFSVMAIQTDDLGIRRGENFELVGRSQLAEPRGCSLMAT